MDNPFVIYHGDCLEVMRGMEADSVDAIVTDPPYGLVGNSRNGSSQPGDLNTPYGRSGPSKKRGFMGKEWDGQIPDIPFWAEALRVAKPGAHLLAFGGTRTFHRLACASEDAGWEIRDCVMWVYGSGFPKSLDVSKAIDKAAGVERDVIGLRKHPTLKDSAKIEEQANAAHGSNSWAREWVLTAPAIDAARQWSGCGTALKPAWEPIILARKPIIGTVAENVLRHGCGGLNIAACRVQGNDLPSACKGTGWAAQDKKNAEQGYRPKAYYDQQEGVDYVPHSAGRFPANLLHDNSPEVVDLFPVTGPSKAAARGGTNPNPMDWGCARPDGGIIKGHDDTGGSAARFFQACPDNDPEDAEARRLIYCAKASKADRDEGCEGLEERGGHLASPDGGGGGWKADAAKNPNLPRRNHHPTVKATPLMRYLCRLITPPNGVILDPFAGSGSTGKAAILEGFRFVGIEQDAEYVAIAEARLRHAVDNKAGQQGKLDL